MFKFKANLQETEARDQDNRGILFLNDLDQDQSDWPSD